jgi:4-hydroxy-4-methyl-2-oxoglutarate aldolase
MPGRKWPRRSGPDTLCTLARALDGLFAILADMVMPEVNVPVLLGNVTVNPGDILLGDDDGIVIATEVEMAAAIDKAEAIQFTQGALCSSIAEGACLFDKLNFDEHVTNLRAGKASLLSFDA